jgi:hypothetical protein
MKRASNVLILTGNGDNILADIVHFDVRNCCVDYIGIANFVRSCSPYK